MRGENNEVLKKKSGLLCPLRVNFSLDFACAKRQVYLCCLVLAHRYAARQVAVVVVAVVVSLEVAVAVVGHVAVLVEMDAAPAVPASVVAV